MPNSESGSGVLDFRIVSVTRETKEANTYVLELESPQAMPYSPGQFLTFLIHIDGQEYRRSFSILSLSGEPLAVTVKRVENGAVSRYILAHWAEHQRIRALPPAGRFTLPAGITPRDLFFIVAGSGITPALPQIRYLLKAEPNSLIHLVYSNRNEADTLFRARIAALKEQFLQLNVYEFLSDPLDPLLPRRRLNNGALEELVRRHRIFDPADAVFMVCGPFTYMRMARITLIFMHFKEGQIHRENFLPGIMRGEPETKLHFEEQTITLNYAGFSRRISVKPGQTILRAALAAGIMLPYSCEGGACSTCAAKCSRGKVTMTINEVLTDKDLAEGWILTCTGHPADERVEISYPVSIQPAAI